MYNVLVEIPGHNTLLHYMGHIHNILMLYSQYSQLCYIYSFGHFATYKILYAIATILIMLYPQHYIYTSILYTQYGNIYTVSIICTICYYFTKCKN